MKFFTPEACETFWEYEPFRAVYDAYRHHLYGLRGVLPQHVLDLADLPGVGDGLVVCVDHDREKRVLRLVLRCGDLQMGYYNLELVYIDAEILPEHDLALAKIARTTKSQSFFGSDLANHEFDAAPEERIEHRLIFNALEWHHPEAGGYLWFSVICRELRWRRLPKRSRRLPPLADRYPGGPTTTFALHCESSQ